MEATNLSNINQAYIQKQNQPAVSNENIPQAPETKKDGNKLLLAGALAVASIAAAGIAIYRHKNAAKALDILPNGKKVHVEENLLNKMQENAKKSAENIQHSKEILSQVDELSDDIAKTRKDIASLGQEIDDSLEEAQGILSDLEAKTGKVKIKPFKVVEFVNKEGLACKATKQGDIVTILKPDNTTYTVALKDFFKEVTNLS